MRPIRQGPAPKCHGGHHSHELVLGSECNPWGCERVDPGWHRLDVPTMEMVPFPPPLLLCGPPSLQVGLERTLLVKKKLRSLLSTYSCPVTASSLVSNARPRRTQLPLSGHT